MRWPVRWLSLSDENVFLLRDRWDVYTALLHVKQIRGLSETLITSQTNPHFPMWESEMRRYLNSNLFFCRISQNGVLVDVGHRSAFGHSGYAVYCHHGEGRSNLILCLFQYRYESTLWANTYSLSSCPTHKTFCSLRCFCAVVLEYCWICDHKMQRSAM